MLALDGLTPEIAATKLGEKAFTAEIDGDVMTILARGDVQQLACCTPQVSLTRLGHSSYWAVRLRMADLDRAYTTVMVRDQVGADLDDINAAYKARFEWRGPNAPPLRRLIDPNSDQQGAVEARVIDSVALGEKRKVDVWLPPGWNRHKSWPVAFIGDGGAKSFSPMVAAMIEDGLVEPMILVGLYAGWQALVDGDPALRVNDGDMRNAEYTPAYGAPGRYEAHLAFVADEVTAWVSREYGASTLREDRLVMGYSGGGSMALFAGLHRPDVFGYSVPLSPATLPPRPEDMKPGERATFHMSGGLYEPPYLAQMKNIDVVLRKAGYDVTTEYPATGHFSDHWQQAFGDALLRFFPKR